MLKIERKKMATIKNSTIFKMTSENDGGVNSKQKMLYKVFQNFLSYS